MVEYKLGDLVWFDLSRVVRTKKAGLKRWIGPCKIVNVSPGGLYGLEYVEDHLGKTYSRMHSDAIKPFRGELGS